MEENPLKLYSRVILLRGGGDIASGVALRLHRVGLKILITELSQPLVVRRSVSFANAVYSGEWSVEGVVAKRVAELDSAKNLLAKGGIPVMVDPQAGIIDQLFPLVLVDGRMTKQKPELGKVAAPLVIGLGPGFYGGINCHAAIETRRGPKLGRVVWQGETEKDTGIPERVGKYTGERVLRAPTNGFLKAYSEIGDLVEIGQTIAEVSGKIITSPFKGILRGLLNPGIEVFTGMKIGDVDPRLDPSIYQFVSDKALAVGGGVLEAILTVIKIRCYLWECDETI